MTSLAFLAGALLLATLVFVVMRAASPRGTALLSRATLPAGRPRAFALAALAGVGLCLGAAAWLGRDGVNPAHEPEVPATGALTRGLGPAPAERASPPVDALAATAAALAQTTAERRKPATEGGQAAGPDIEALLARLQQRLERQPDDADGWLMLANSNASLERHAAAVKAYARAAALRPQDAQIRADWADAAAMAQGGTARGEPTRLLDEALALDPKNVKARVMAGLAAQERSDLAGARRHFEAAIAAAPADSPVAKAMRERLAALPAAESAR